MVPEPSSPGQIYLAVGLMDETVHLAQSEPASLVDRLRRKERLEDLISDRGLDAVARVLNCDERRRDATLQFLFDFDLDPPPSGIASRELRVRFSRPFPALPDLPSPQR